MSQTLGDIEDLKKVTYTVEMVCLFYANSVLHLQGVVFRSIFTNFSSNI